MKIYLSKIINLFLAFIMCTTWSLDAVDKKSSPCSNAKSSKKAQFSFDIRSNKKTIFAVGIAAATITSFFALKRQSLTLPSSFLDSIKRLPLTYNQFPVFSHTFLTNLRQAVEQHPKFLTAGSICTVLGTKKMYNKYKFAQERRDQERRDQERLNQERREQERREQERREQERLKKLKELNLLRKLTYSPPVTKICITDPDFISKRTDPTDPYTQAQNPRSFFTSNLFLGIDKTSRTY